MYLSQLTFHKINKNTRQVLIEPYKLHACVMSGFKAHKTKPNEPSGVLYRIEPYSPHAAWTNVLVQSRFEPDWHDTAQNYGEAFQCRCKPFDLTTHVGQVLRFRLRANPTVTKNGRRFGLLEEEAQRDWLLKQAAQHGFETAYYTLVDEGIAEIQKDTHKISIYQVLYDGTLCVTNADKFSQSVQNGIGPAKGFGCGLLSLARAE